MINSKLNLHIIGVAVVTGWLCSVGMFSFGVFLAIGILREVDLFLK